MSPSLLWAKPVVRSIWKKAKTGEYLVRGFGTNRPYPNLDDLVVVPAQLTGPAAVDKYRESINTRVIIGEDLARPLVLETPVFIAAMSFGAISKPGKLAFAYAAAKAGTATNTGEGGSPPEELQACREGGEGKIVAQWSTGRFGVNTEYLRMADAIEIKIGQGAKPGMGGHLMAEKVSPEVARVRGIPLGTDALSPCRHLDVDSVDDLKKHVQLLREITNYEIPIIIKLGPADVYDDIVKAVELGADAVAIDGGEGGTGCSPAVASDHAGVPTLGLFAPAVRALRDTGAAERGIKLMLMGGIRDGADIYKAIALGADCVGIATAAMIAIGCTACELCHTGKCQPDIATQKPDEEIRLDWRRAGGELFNYIKAITEELKVLTALSGHGDISELSPEDLVAMTYDASAITGIKLMGLDRPVPLWENGS